MKTHTPSRSLFLVLSVLALWALAGCNSGPSASTKSKLSDEGSVVWLENK